MADGISIPGVTDRYKTNDLVEALMETERVPLKREQAQLQKYQDQQSAWREVNQKMASLRESVKTLYSFENPFNNKFASSSDENAITVDAARGAEYGSFKIDVIQPATADRFLSKNVDRAMKVEAGLYTFEVGEKTISFNWKGGKLTDFVTALNKRSSNTIKASLIGVTSKERSLLIESLKPGLENRLIFKDKALDFAKSIGMISDSPLETTALSDSLGSFSAPETKDAVEQANMPKLSSSGVKTDGEHITIPSRGGIEIKIPDTAREGDNACISFTFNTRPTEDITIALNDSLSSPTLPEPGFIEYRGIKIINAPSETALNITLSQEGNTTPVEPVEDEHFVSLKNDDGTEDELTSNELHINDEGTASVTISLNEHPHAISIIIRNSNTGKELSMTAPQSYDAAQGVGFLPNNAISQASDAQFKYEGITISRSSNDIDDVIPDITLHLHNKTEKTATITIEPDTESAKDALITFVGKYNQVLAEINILTSDKPEIVSELDYLSADEREEKLEKLGMFMGDFTLQNGKSQLQRIISANYRYSDDAMITMLNQIGISTNASGRSTGYNASQMRGYLEVDEKLLDSKLAENLDEIKDLFGYDSDGDLITDNGIGYMMDRQLGAWTQTGGIIATKTSSLETQIKSSNTKITKLQTQLDDKEAELKRKYSNMEGTLNSLESQQNSLNNWSNSFNRQK